MFNGKLKIKNVIILLVMSIAIIGLGFHLYLSYNTMERYKKTVEQLNQKIEIRNPSDEIIKNYRVIRNNGESKVIDELEVFSNLGFEKTLEGVNGLLKYQPPSLEDKILFYGEDLNEVKLVISRLKIKAMYLAMSYDQKIYVMSDGNIILKIDNDQHMYVFELEEKSVRLNSYLNKQAFDD